MGVVTRPHPPATHARKHEGSAYTLGIVLENKGTILWSSESTWIVSYCGAVVNL